MVDNVKSGRQIEKQRFISDLLKKEDHYICAAGLSQWNEICDRQIGKDIEKEKIGDDHSGESG